MLRNQLPVLLCDRFIVSRLRTKLSARDRKVRWNVCSRFQNGSATSSSRSEETTPESDDVRSRKQRFWESCVGGYSPLCQKTSKMYCICPLCRVLVTARHAFYACSARSVLISLFCVCVCFQLYLHIFHRYVCNPYFFSI